MHHYPQLKCRREKYVYKYIDYDRFHKLPLLWARLCNKYVSRSTHKSATLLTCGALIAIANNKII